MKLKDFLEGKDGINRAFSVAVFSCSSSNWLWQILKTFTLFSSAVVLVSFTSLVLVNLLFIHRFSLQKGLLLQRFVVSSSGYNMTRCYDWLKQSSWWADTNRCFIQSPNRFPTEGASLLQTLSTRW